MSQIQVRNKQIASKITLDEYVQIRAEAVEAGMSIASYVRSRLGLSSPTLSIIKKQNRDWAISHS